MNPHRSPIFVAVSGIVFVAVNVLALHLFWRGHNLPGGGFIAGMASAVSLILLAMARGLTATHRLFRVDPLRVAVGGLLLAGLTAAAPLVLGAPFLRHYHWKKGGLPLLGDLYLGTPQLFDLGVYLVVVGVVVKIYFVLAASSLRLFELSREDSRHHASALEEPIEEHPGLRADREERI